jgi:hypothetical protein
MKKIATKILDMLELFFIYFDKILQLIWNYKVLVDLSPTLWSLIETLVEISQNVTSQFTTTCDL